MSSIICDGYMVDQIVDEFATPVIIREVTKTFESEYGDATESYKDYSTNVLIQSWSQDEDEVREGMFKSGTLTLTFKLSDNSLAKSGNKVKYLDEWYIIDRVVKQPVAGTLYYVYCVLNKA